jgi:hypothetical protein
MELESEVNREALIGIVEVEAEQPDRLHGAGRLYPPLADVRRDAKRVERAVQFFAQLGSMLAIESQHRPYLLLYERGGRAAAEHVEERLQRRVRHRAHDRRAVLGRSTGAKLLPQIKVQRSQQAARRAALRGTRPPRSG